jgi:hypothetical protein
MLALLATMVVSVQKMDRTPFESNLVPMIKASYETDLIYRQLKRMGTLYNPELDIDLASISISDAGNVQVAGDDLEATHKSLRTRIESLIANGSVPFVIGGGNDQSFPNACGLLDAKKRFVGNARFCCFFAVVPHQNQSTTKREICKHWSDKY